VPTDRSTANAQICVHDDPLRHPIGIRFGPTTGCRWCRRVSGSNGALPRRIIDARSLRRRGRRIKGRRFNTLVRRAEQSGAAPRPGDGERVGGARSGCGDVRRCRCGLRVGLRLRLTPTYDRGRRRDASECSDAWVGARAAMPGAAAAEPRVGLRLRLTPTYDRGSSSRRFRVLGRVGRRRRCDVSACSDAWVDVVVATFPRARTRRSTSSSRRFRLLGRVGRTERSDVRRLYRSSAIGTGSSSRISSQFGPSPARSMTRKSDTAPSASNGWCQTPRA